MKAETAKSRTWNRTKVQGLLRHRGGAYYARLYVAGKEKWLALETSVLEVAKAKLKEEKIALAEAKKIGWELQAGQVKTEAAIHAYQEHLKLRVGLKESTRNFYQWSLKAILTSWPELPMLDVRHVTDSQCREWAKKFSGKYSATYYTRDQVKALLAVADVEWTGMILFGAPATVLESKTLHDSLGTTLTKSKGFFASLPKRPVTRGKDARKLPPSTRHLGFCQAKRTLGQEASGPLFSDLCRRPTGGVGGLSIIFRKRVMREAGIYAEEESHPRLKGKGRRFFSLGFHSFRHTSISGQANLGISKEVRMKLSGHKSEVHERYAHHELETLRKEIVKVPSFLK